MVENKFEPQGVDLFDYKNWHACIVGGGIAGLTAAATILEKGGKVLIVEKEAQLGGNSAKDCSGMNVVTEEGDSLEMFKEDTLKSAGESANPELIDALVENAAKVYSWVEFKVLKNRVKECMVDVAQLGGHSKPRTHRPSATKPAVGFGEPTPMKPAGQEILDKLIELIHSYVEKGTCTLWLETKATFLWVNHSRRLEGICFRRKIHDDEPEHLSCLNIVLATGGYLADRSSESPLVKHHPELRSVPTSSGSFAKGEAIPLAEYLRATFVDMDKIHIHPTGFVDPADPSSSEKELAPDVLRAIGGILLKDDGTRFCNELDLNKDVTEQILQLNTDYADSKAWKEGEAMPQVTMLMSAEAAATATNVVEPFVSKGLMTKVTGLSGLAEHLKISKDALQTTLQEYKAAADEGKDAFGKTVFNNVPPAEGDNVEYYVGTVTPVLHQCLGGLKINKNAEVQGFPMKLVKKNYDEKKDSEEQKPPPEPVEEHITGLYAAGEAAAGVHGDNPLGGNNLLECLVFGRIAGESICKTTNPKLMY